MHMPSTNTLELGPGSNQSHPAHNDENGCDHEDTKSCVTHTYSSCVRKIPISQNTTPSTSAQAVKAFSELKKTLTKAAANAVVPTLRRSSAMALRLVVFIFFL